MKSKVSEKTIFDIDKKSKKNKTIYEEIKVSSLRKKYLKILKFLNSKNIDIKDIDYKKKIYGKDNKILIPNFVCYQPNHIKDQENIFLVVIYNEDKANIDSNKEICKDYFYNLDNLFFVLIFDGNLTANLFYRKEEDNETYLLQIKEKHIAKFN